MSLRSFILRGLLAVTLALNLSLAAWQSSPKPAHAQDPTPLTPQVSDQVRALIARMSVQQRVGQLFVISFPEADASEGSDIADLIQNYRVGGVQLMAMNRNFSRDVTDPPTPQQVSQLANALQVLAMPDNSAILAAEEMFVAPSTRVAITTSVTQTITPTVSPPLPTSIPLFIALAQQADWVQRLELSEITRGITQVPSQLALGATWNPATAQSAGEILGNELSQLGINVLFGPTLDVVDVPRPNTPGDLGTHVFGGDPYWVGRMGQAFVTGVHRGSGNRMAVIARNFPGLGSSDRNINDEIPTVQKSLEQLKQIELAPFFAVTRGDVAQESTVDGLLVSHIRYRGFQGNIRASTRPVSFDPQAYQALMSLPELAQWRASGGVTFSDQLGARGVRRFYDPLESSFNARRIAQEAFAAGNDVLVLGNFGLSNSWPEQLANIKDTIRFFQTKYVEDPNFAARVDESLARILTLKLRLYGGAFSRDATQVSEAGVALLQPQTGATAAIAKESITLLSPNVRDLPTVLPTAPTRDESIVFISDDRQIRECQACEPYPAVARTALEEIALALYGPRTTGQVDPARVSSFTFSDLVEYNALATAQVTPTVTPDGAGLLPTITSPAGEPAEATPDPQSQTPDIAIESAIERSSWVVIAMLDTNPFITPTLALRTFLSQSADTLKDKRVIVFALAAPYYLDATEISKVTAYFGVYSRTRAYLETAMRALFGEFVPTGDSPVSIPGLNYSLIVQTAPDPAQVIPLIQLTEGDTITDTATAATPEPLALKIGDKLKLIAGPIYDLNGRVVPDGTQVQFILSYPAERVEQRLPAVSTRDGVADTTVALERQGKLEIRAEADPATASYVVLVDTTDVVSIETIKPTVAPTPTPLPTATVAERVTPAVTAVASAEPPVAPPPERTSVMGFLLTLIGLLGIGLGLFAVLSQVGPALSATARLRIALGSWCLGWLAYSLTALGFPGTRWATDALGWGGSALIAVLLALAMGGIALAIASASKPRVQAT
jgi:beta-N-acetylhexosaminidase